MIMLMIDQPPSTFVKTLASLSQMQRERMAYIDFKLCFLGEFTRSDLMTRFGIATAAATRDISLYRALAPSNAILGRNKAYRPSQDFAPLMTFEPVRVLSALTQEGSVDLLSEATAPLVRSARLTALALPRLETLAPVTRAIHLKQIVKIGYISAENGVSEREVAPFAIFDSGARWYMRAYCRMRAKFIDLALRRITSAEIVENSPAKVHESAEADTQWSRIIDLELVVHPNSVRPEMVALDYDLVDGVLKVQARASQVGYLLRHWWVDCSVDHGLPAREYELWLKDPLSIYGASSEAVAPRDSKKESGK